jgi:hypothetical protein
LEPGHVTIEQSTKALADAAKLLDDLGQAKGHARPSAHEPVPARAVARPMAQEPKKVEVLAPLQFKSIGGEPKKNVELPAQSPEFKASGNQPASFPLVTLPPPAAPHQPMLTPVPTPDMLNLRPVPSREPPPMLPPGELPPGDQPTRAP